MSKILIADDVKDMRNLLGQILDSSGYEYIEASSGHEVLQILEDKTHRIGLILMDISMPGMDGIQTIKAIRQINKDIKVCFVSGHKDKEIVLKAIQAGGNDYIVKPIDVSILVSKIKKFLGGYDSSSFLTISTKMKASFPNVPLDLEIWITEVSEVGLKFECYLPLKQGERVDLNIPLLSKLIDYQKNFECEIDSIFTDKKSGKSTLSCSFYGQHENDRTKIRSVVIKGKAIYEDPSEEEKPA